MNSVEHLQGCSNPRAGSRRRAGIGDFLSRLPRDRTQHGIWNSPHASDGHEAVGPGVVEQALAMPGDDHLLNMLMAQWIDPYHGAMKDRRAPSRQNVRSRTSARLRGIFL